MKNISPEEEVYVPDVSKILAQTKDKFVWKSDLEEGCPNFGGGNVDGPERKTEVLNELVERQPAPKKNNHPAVADLVMADLRDRDQFGEKKYGTRLQPFNGRKPKIDLYQELQDALQYVRADIYEQEYIDRVVKAAIQYVQHQDSNRVSDLFEILETCVKELQDARNS